MKYLVSFFLLFLVTDQIKSQVFLQLERRNSAETIKLPEGTILEYTTKEYPNVWHREEIVSLIPEEQVLVLEEGFKNIDELAKIRRYRPWAKSVSYGLLQFSAGWYLYGAIATLVDEEYKMSKDEIIIGGVFAAIGYLIKKIFYKRTIKLGKLHNLRIVDLRMNVKDF